MSNPNPEQVEALDRIASALFHRREPQTPWDIAKQHGTHSETAKVREECLADADAALASRANRPADDGGRSEAALQMTPDYAASRNAKAQQTHDFLVREMGVKPFTVPVVASTEVTDRPWQVEAIRRLRDDWQARRFASEWSGIAVAYIDDIFVGLLNHYSETKSDSGIKDATE